jgi:hypothetical protein
VIPVIIHDRQIIYHRDYIDRRIDGALATRITGNFTFRESSVAVLQVLASDPKPVTDRVQRKQIFGTRVDTVSTSGT